MEREINLFKAIIIQGLMDSLQKFLFKESKNDYYYITAYEWLGSDDFKFICEHANLNPNNVLKIYKKFKQYKDYLTADTTKVLLHEAFNRHKQL